MYSLAEYENHMPLYENRMLDFNNILENIIFKKTQTVKHSTDNKYKADLMANKQFKNNINTFTYGYLGDNQIWKDINDMIRKHHRIIDNPSGMDMDGVSQYDLKNINRINIPLHLTPGISTFKDVTLHALIRQRLKPTTVAKHLRSLRFMETHEIPVDLINPSYENFLRHMDYREQNGAGYSALRHEWDAMKMLLKAFGIPIWDYKPPSKTAPKPRILPPPDIVWNMMHRKYSKNLYENALYQYLYTFSFTVGWRVPSEICTMKTEDVHINKGFIIITEPKKGNTQRQVFLRKNILSSPRSKSFYNWLQWRSKIENEKSGDALFLWPSGKPVTTRKLGQKLSENGKKTWQYFRPYDMRHWSAIARLIETKINTGKYDEYEIKDHLGHTEIQTTMSYIKYAKHYYRQYPYNWINRVLKFHHNSFLGLLDLNHQNSIRTSNVAEELNTLNPREGKKNCVLAGFQSDKSDGSTGIYHLQQIGNQLRYPLNIKSWDINSTSLNFSLLFSHLPPKLFEKNKRHWSDNNFFYKSKWPINKFRSILPLLCHLRHAPISIESKESIRMTNKKRPVLNLLLRYFHKSTKKLLRLSYAPATIVTFFSRATKIFGEIERYEWRKRRFFKNKIKLCFCCQM